MEAAYQSSGPTTTSSSSPTRGHPRRQTFLPPNTDGHCCILVTRGGVAATDDGFMLYGDTNLPSTNTILPGIDICTNLWEGQTNIMILPLSGHFRLDGFLLGNFAFLSGFGNRGQRGEVTVEVTPLAQPNGVDPSVLRVLQAGSWKGLPLRPATSGPRGLGLRKNSHKYESFSVKIICEAEEIIEDLLEVIEGRPDCIGVFALKPRPHYRRGFASLYFTV